MVADRQLNARFRKLLEQVSVLLDVSPLPRKQDRVVQLVWADVPLEYNKPRFGVIEQPHGKNPRSGWVVAVSKELLNEAEHVFDWMLWREAILTFLLPHIRQVPEAADLGLFGGLKYGIRSPKHNEELQKLWKRLSPPQYLTFYIYDPTLGFPMFDTVVDGKFLQTAITWLNTIRGTYREPLPSRTYTAALERWMLETHQPLNVTEVRILSSLAKDPSLTQVQLAQILKMKTSTLSQALQRLAQKHLLRIDNFITFPMIGLHPLTAIFHFNGKKIHQRMISLLSRIKYTQSIRNYSKKLLVANFLIPQHHINQFHQWVEKTSQILELPPPSIHSVTDLLSSWNFSYYKPDIGWPEDFTPILNQMHSIVKETIPSPQTLRRFRYHYKIIQNDSFTPLKLRNEDFTYLRRSTEILRVAEKIVSRTAEEVREAGIPESAHMRYRRRIQKFEKLHVSTHRHYGMFHIGLNTVIQILVLSSLEQTEKIFEAGSLLPYFDGYIFDNGFGEVIILVPNHVAVDVHSAMRRILGENDIDAVITAQPAWRAFVGLPPPLAPENYDFNTGEWIWSQNTLPDSEDS